VVVASWRLFTPLTSSFISFLPTASTSVFIRLVSVSEAFLEQIDRLNGVKCCSGCSAYPESLPHVGGPDFPRRSFAALLSSPFLAEDKRLDRSRWLWAQLPSMSALRRCDWFKLKCSLERRQSQMYLRRGSSYQVNFSGVNRSCLNLTHGDLPP
jgi:hypothetical protein